MFLRKKHIIFFKFQEGLKTANFLGITEFSYLLSKMASYIRTKYLVLIRYTVLDDIYKKTQLSYVLSNIINIINN